MATATPNRYPFDSPGFDPLKFEDKPENFEISVSDQLEGTLARLTRVAGLLEELQSGPQVAEDQPSRSEPRGSGLIALAAQCDKASMILENHAVILLKRIGHL